MAFKSGDYNIICAKCGGKMKGSQARMDGHWKGLAVCEKCYDRKHPQDYPDRIPSSEGKPPRLVNPWPATDTFDGASVVESYSSGNQDGLTEMYASNNEQVGQSFTLTRGALFESVKLFLKKTGSPTGDALVRIYNSSSDIPTGAQIGNTQTIDVSTLDTTLTEVEFLMNDIQTRSTGVESNTAETIVVLRRDIPLSAKEYAILVEYTGGDASNTISIGHDESSPTHEGKLFTTNTAGSGWSADDNKDLVFEVTGGLAAVLNTTPEN